MSLQSGDSDDLSTGLLAVFPEAEVVVQGLGRRIFRLIGQPAGFCSPAGAAAQILHLFV